eukprot:781112_1
MAFFLYLFCIIYGVNADLVRPTNIKVTYFNVPGRGHPIRTALYLSDIPYEEELLEWDPFVEMRNRDELEWFGLPELTLTFKDGNSVKVGQSTAILTYVGKLGGLYPKDALIQLYVDELLNAVEDLGNIMRPSYKEQNKDKQLEMRKGLVDDKTHKGITYWFRKFEAKLKKNAQDNRGSKYFVGSEMTVADLKLYYYFNSFYGNKYDGIDGKKILDENYPVLAAFINNME